MDKEENALRISEFISKSLDDCLEEGELQELEKWLTEDERHRELFALWSSTELMERKAEVYERLDYMRVWEEFRKVRQDKLSARRRRIRITWMKYAAMFIVPLGIAVALLSKEDIKREDGGTDNGESREISSRISLVVGRKAGPGLGRKKYRGRGNED